MEISEGTARQYLSMAIEEMKRPDCNLIRARNMAIEAIRQLRALEAYNREDF